MLFRSAGLKDDLLEVQRRLAKENPDDVTTRLAIAARYEADGRLPEQIGTYEEITRARGLPPPAMAEHRMKLASLYERNGQRNEALAQYREVLKGDPKHSAAAEAVKRLGG